METEDAQVLIVGSGSAGYTARTGPVAIAASVRMRARICHQVGGIPTYLQKSTELCVRRIVFEDPTRPGSHAGGAVADRATPKLEDDGIDFRRGPGSEEVPEDDFGTGIRIGEVGSEKKCPIPGDGFFIDRAQTPNTQLLEDGIELRDPDSVWVDG